MAPTARSQSAKSPSTTAGTDVNDPETGTNHRINTATLTLPMTPSQLASLDPYLLCKPRSSPSSITALPAEEINKLHTLARTASPTALNNTITFNCVARGGEPDTVFTKIGLLPAGVLLLAIEPTTGNSLLHSAISAGRVDNADTLMGFFGPEMGHNGGRPTLGRNVAIRKLLGHGNARGETILHVAVRTGYLKAVVGAYRVFCLSEVEEEREGEDYDDLGPENDMDASGGTDGSSYEAGDIDETTWEGWEGAAEWVEKLLFVITRDGEGKTAEEAARELGHEKIALWLGRVVEKLDPKGRRDSQVEIERMKRYMKWAYYEDEDGPERNRREEEAFRKKLPPSRWDR